MESRSTRLAREQAERRAIPDKATQEALARDDAPQAAIVAAGSSQPGGPQILPPPPSSLLPFPSDGDAGLHPCFWESEPGEEECMEPNAAGSFWCAKHTDLAFTVGDPAGDAWGIRHGFPPPPPPNPKSPIQNPKSPPSLEAPFKRSHEDPSGDQAVPSGNQAKYKSPGQVHPTCAGTTRKGLPCTFPARRGTDRCINHEPGADTANAALRAAQAAAVVNRKPSTELIATVFSLTDRASIQAVLDTVIRLSFANRLSAENARTILRACTIATRNFDAAGETLEGPRRQQHEWYPYFDKVQRLLTTIDPVLQTAAEEQAETLAALQAAYSQNSPSPAQSGEGAGG